MLQGPVEPQIRLLSVDVAVASTLVESLPVCTVNDAPYVMRTRRLLSYNS